MNKCLTFLLLIAFIQFSPIHAEPKNTDTIFLVSEEWARATLSDGSGLYWDIFRLVYEPVGIKVELLTMPYDLSVNYVHRGQADAWLASYKDEKDFALYPQWHFDTDIVSVMFHKGRQTQFEGISSLAHKHVAWISGYDYHLYIDEPMNKHEMNTRQSILRMLKNGRIDFFLDAKIELKQAKEIHYPNDDSLITHDLIKLHLYPAFADTPRGERFRNIWDKRMPEIYQTQKMKNLFKRWQYIYPFEEGSDKNKRPESITDAR